LKKLVNILKEYYPPIVLVVILFFLLIDLENYHILIIFSNVFGFSIVGNSIIKERYKKNILSRNSVYGLNVINLLNIIGCFLNYDDYIRIIFIIVIFLTLTISLKPLKWIAKKLN